MLRNKIKRAIRENFKVHKSHILAKDIIVIARQPAKDMTTLQIQNSLEHVLKIAKVFNKRLSKNRVGEREENINHSIHPEVLPQTSVRLTPGI